MHKPIKYVEKAVTLGASGAWFLLERFDRIEPNPAPTPKWSDKPLLKSSEAEARQATTIPAPPGNLGEWATSPASSFFSEPPRLLGVCSGGRDLFGSRSRWAAGCAATKSRAWMRGGWRALGDGGRDSVDPARGPLRPAYGDDLSETERRRTGKAGGRSAGQDVSRRHLDLVAYAPCAHDGGAAGGIFRGSKRACTEPWSTVTAATPGVRQTEEVDCDLRRDRASTDVLYEPRSVTEPGQPRVEPVYRPEPGDHHRDRAVVVAADSKGR